MENPMQAAPPPPPPPRRRPDMGNRHPPPPPQKCPRCLSSNTKFCYYNNYSLSQPRYFCKACRRYWTHGGTLRNIPVGGGIRRNRSARPAPPPPPAVSPRAIPAVLRAPIPPPMGNGGSFFNGSASQLADRMNLAAGLPNLGRGGQYDGPDMALLQSFQSLQPASNDQMFPPQQGLNVNQERLGLRPWTQTFMKGSTSGESSSGFTGRADEGYQAGSNPFDLWSDNNNPSSN